MSRAVWLLRHPPVAKAWAGRCYGRADMGWSREGIAKARQLTEDLSTRPIDLIVHSGAWRTSRLAEMVSRRRGTRIVEDLCWRERDFGTWEGRTWHWIWRETGALMDRMITDPEHFRPGGGETGRELSDRVSGAWRRLPRSGSILVIAHGGSIAALRAALSGEPLQAMVDHIPGCSELVGPFLESV